VIEAFRGNGSGNARYFAGAPTRAQAKEIFWLDLKAMVPPEMMAKKVSESELVIYLINGSEIHVRGLDRPERIEGSPWDGCILDEYANMKASAWTDHIRPAMSERGGWCWFTGVPEGRNHYYKMAQDAMNPQIEDWGHYTWFSSDILPKHEIEAAKRELDERTFKQEYEGAFVDFEGRAYYSFSVDKNCRPLDYDPRADLVICFDFNVSPGVASVIQEQEIDGQGATCIIDEVFIPLYSNTEKVCRKLLEDWGHHDRNVYLYGDATGGSKKTSALSGSDWDIIENMFRSNFGNRTYLKVPRSNPSERARVNAMNSRICSTDESRSLFIDSIKCPKTVEDFDGTTVLDGTSGELNKSMDGPNKNYTHLTDAIGYYIDFEFPIMSNTKAAHNIQMPGRIY
jgi:hypothetical protein